MMMLEVMDKELGITGMWIGAALWGGGGFFACRRWPWAALLLVPVLALADWGLYDEIHDPFVGPAILQEAGAAYPLHAYATSVLTLALIAAGVAAHVRLRARLPSSS
jgi:hypothetical protein